MEVVKICPFCGESSTLYVKDGQIEKYEAGASVQEAFDDIDSFGRELIISGVCFNCQEKVFNRPLKCHEASWGRELFECECCGTPIYSEHNKSKKNPNAWECPSCRSTYDETGKEL